MMTATDPLRILRVSQWLYPEELGGGAYHVHALSRDQAARGHDVTVLTMSPDESKPRREHRDGYRVIRRRPLASPLGNEISLRLISDIFRAGDYDVVHAHSHFYFATNVAAFACRIGQTPLAITNHSLYSQSAPERLFGMYLRTLGRWTLNSADLVFCYTDEERERSRELGVDTEIRVVPNGIDPSRFTPDGPKTDLIDASPTTPTILFAGRLVEGKRPQDALATLTHVHESHPDAQLYMCGDGPLKPELVSRAVDLGIEDTVHFLGHVDYDQMPTVYRAGDVFFLPSRAEGIPRTVMEALASETPVVVSDLPQLRELVDGTGYTVPVGNIEGFSDAIVRLLNDPGQREAFGSKGREVIREQHSWKQTVAQTSSELQDLGDE